MLESGTSEFVYLIFLDTGIVTELERSFKSDLAEE